MVKYQIGWILILLMSQLFLTMKSIKINLTCQHFHHPVLRNEFSKSFLVKTINVSDKKDLLKSRKKCHLHEIRNLSEKFIYFNDDITFFNPICPEDYFEDENYKLYLNGKASGYPSGRGQGHMDHCPGILPNHPGTKSIHLTLPIRYRRYNSKKHGQYGDRTRDIRVISTTL